MAANIRWRPVIGVVSIQVTPPAQHVARDRPLVIVEIGVNTQSFDFP
jgi:hypothetical protein